MLTDILREKLEDITPDMINDEMFNDITEEIAGCGCGVSGKGTGGCSGECGCDKEPING